MPASEEVTRRLWEDHMAGRPIDPSPLKPYIRRSWQISKNCGVDPFTTLAPRILSAKDLAALRAKHETLLQAVDPVMRMVEVSIRNTGFIATLTVAPGYLLEVVGDSSVMPVAERGFNVAGAVRTLETVGTSALTLSILEKAPVQVEGHEHYNRTFHNWTCSSAPIFDIENNAVASLTISGHIRGKQEHTFAMVKAACEGISTRLREIFLLREQQRLNSMLNSIHNSLPDAVFSLNNNLKVTHANRHACLLLQAEEALSGRGLAQMVPPEDQEEIRSILHSGKPAGADVRFLINGQEVKHPCRFMPIHGDDGKTLGTTVIIAPEDAGLDAPRRGNGNYAKYDFKDILGASPAMKRQIDLARRAGNSGARILLTGESGTGKELFAQAIHNNSRERKGPFVAVSCAAIPKDLIESELFGYVGGAFTGAREKGLPGKFELASGGTLFLDEINSLPWELQGKLLRVLQQGEITRIGGSQPLPVSVRVITASNINLREAAQRGEFREDLHYRINVVEIAIPPLRDRKEDIPILTGHTMRRLCRETRLPFAGISPEATLALHNYDWPGNVRELENVCELALLMANGEHISPDHLPAHIAGSIPPAPAPASLSHTTTQAIKQALDRHNNNLTRAAASLGIARTTLYRQMKKHGLMEII